jgi:hypothetical protein
MGPGSRERLRLTAAQNETHLNPRSHLHRDPGFSAWLEAPLADGLDSLPIETGFEGPEDLYVPRPSALINDNREYNCSLKVCIPGLF